MTADQLRPIRQVFDTLVGGFHNLRLSSGELITSSTQKNDAAPRMMWKVNGWNTDNWQPYQTHIDWDIPCEFMIQGPPADTGPVLDALDDLYSWTDLIYGLPLDEHGNLIPFGEHQLELAELKKLYTIADRFVGPYIKRATVRPGEADTSFTIVDLVFHVEFVVDNTPKATATADKFTVGLNVNGGQIIRNPSQPFTYPLAAQSDTRSQGAYAKPDTTLSIGGVPVQAQFPPIASGIPAVQGADPSTLLQQVQVVPGAVTVTGAQQLQAIGVFADGGTVSLTASSAWVSSAPSVATVSSGGLITKVSVGTVTISATYNGMIGTASITTA